MRGIILKTTLISIVMAICFTTGCNSQRDVEKLQGKWQLTRMAGDFSFGLTPGKKSDGPEVLVFSDEQFTFKNDERHKTGIAGSYTCDETKSPKQITFTFNDRSVVAIYKIAWGNLSICIGENDQAAPTDFRGGPRARPALLEFDHARPAPGRRGETWLTLFQVCFVVRLGPFLVWLHGSFLNWCCREEHARIVGFDTRDSICRGTGGRDGKVEELVRNAEAKRTT
jgi:uncharacterized protein (TIGR03067 family)